MEANGETKNVHVESLADLPAFFKDQFRPRGKLFTVFNAVSLPIILLGGVLLLYRLVAGLGVANSSNEFPWGIWIGAVVMVGVAFAGGAYVTAFMVYVLRSEKYHPIVRMAVLNGFLAYVFYAGAIFIDCGRWWNIVNPIIGNNFGVNSILFLVAWHFLLYMLAQLIEISPAFAEWLGAKRARKILSAMTLGLSVDFAIHFLQRARELQEKSGDWRMASREMFKEPATAISRNAIIISLGFTPLLLAPLVPYRTVGFFLAAIMAVSWLGTLFILPAIMTALRKILFQEDTANHR